MTSIEVVTLGGIKGAPEFLHAVAEAARAAGLQVKVSPSYTGSAPILVMYGCGSPAKGGVMRQHMAGSAKRHVICWDLGYFSRGSKGVRNFFRVSIDTLHPTLKQIEETPEEPTRFDMHGIQLSEGFNPDGPVIVVGLGRKSREGLALTNWEVGKLAEARARFPLRSVIYRPKPTQRMAPDGVVWPHIDGNTPIADLLRGASLVICRHSNVALDACVAGIPVECEDGVAAWLYRRTSTPSREERLSLLRRASWWQWNTLDMRQAWDFLLPRIGIGGRE